jgi:hypothetical protein
MFHRFSSHPEPGDGHPTSEKDPCQVNRTWSLRFFEPWGVDGENSYVPMIQFAVSRCDEKTQRSNPHRPLWSPGKTSPGFQTLSHIYQEYWNALIFHYLYLIFLYLPLFFLICHYFTAGYWSLFFSVCVHSHGKHNSCVAWLSLSPLLATSLKVLNTDTRR